MIDKFALHFITEFMRQTLIKIIYHHHAQYTFLIQICSISCALAKYSELDFFN